MLLGMYPTSLTGQCAFPCTYAFARVFESYDLNHQLSHKSASSIAWIGALQVFFQFFTGIVAGALFDKIGSRVRRPYSKRMNCSTDSVRNS